MVCFEPGLKLAKISFSTKPLFLLQRIICKFKMFSKENYPITFRYIYTIPPGFFLLNTKFCSLNIFEVV